MPSGSSQDQAPSQVHWQACSGHLPSHGVGQAAPLEYRQFLLPPTLTTGEPQLGLAEMETPALGAGLQHSHGS